MDTLIIDDHPIFISALEALIKRLNPLSRVESSGTVADALERLESKAYQLILLDLNMPGLDGFSFLRALNQRRINTPVAVISSSEDAEMIHASIAAGAIGFIPKAYRTEQIRHAIQQILKGDIYLPEQILQRQDKVAAASPNEAGRLQRCSELGLKAKHLQVLQGLADGLTNKEIAHRMHISVHTVKIYNSVIFERLQTTSRMDAVMEGIRLGLIDQVNGVRKTR